MFLFIIAIPRPRLHRAVKEGNYSPPLQVETRLSAFYEAWSPGGPAESLRLPLKADSPWLPFQRGSGQLRKLKLVPEGNPHASRGTT
jgi:hypothetical protein